MSGLFQRKSTASKFKVNYRFSDISVCHLSHQWQRRKVPHSPVFSQCCQPLFKRHTAKCQTIPPKNANFRKCWHLSTHFVWLIMARLFFSSTSLKKNKIENTAVSPWGINFFKKPVFVMGHLRSRRKVMVPQQKCLTSHLSHSTVVFLLFRAVTEKGQAKRSAQKSEETTQGI